MNCANLARLSEEFDREIAFYNDDINGSCQQP